MRSVNFIGRRVPVPGNIFLRVVLGLVMVVGGFLGFLPVLGFWMLPLGLLILSVDFPPVRRFRRNATVRAGEWIKVRWPAFAQKIGMATRRKSRGEN